MKRKRIRPVAFSLVELLVVIGVIALLIAILVPVISLARKQARATACMANLQQWGQAFQMYASAYNRSPPMHTAPDATEMAWWEILGEFNGDVRATLVCPEAAEPRDNSPDPGDGVQRRYLNPRGTATSAWRVPTYRVAAPQWVLRGDWCGSYGMNNWVRRFPDAFRAMEIVRFPPKDSARVPMLGDCIMSGVYPNPTSSPPKDLQDPEQNSTLPYCIDRHRMAINVAFLDGHVERVPLADLWKLKWSELFAARDVVVPKP